MPKLTITLPEADSDAIATAYAAKIQTAHDLTVAREQASNAWRQAEVARLVAARKAGAPSEVDLTAQPIHERTGAEIPTADAGAALREAARMVEVGGLKGGAMIGEGEPAPAPVDPVVAAEEAHAAAQADFGALVQAACVGHEAEVNALMSVTGARLAVNISTGDITVEAPDAE